MLIYKHTNKINGLSYIGLTKRTMEERWNEHIRLSKNKSTNFQKAIFEYGYSNFSSEILEYCDSIELLHEREQFWIKHFNTIDNGYNMKTGKSQNTQNVHHISTDTPQHYILQEYIKIRILNDTIINVFKDIYLNELSKSNKYFNGYDDLSLDENYILNTSKYINGLLLVQNDMKNSISAFMEEYDLREDEVQNFKTLYDNSLSGKINNLNQEKVSNYNHIKSEYFKLRIQQEDKLSTLSKIQSDQIIVNKNKLKMIKNISMEKIHKYAVKYKKVVSSENTERTINMTFEDLLSEFDYNCAHHYENNKDIILNYISEIFNLHLYMMKIKKELKAELKSFNRNISSALLIQLVSEYNIFKRNVEVITGLDYNIEEFKLHLKQQETLEPIITEIFIDHIERLRNKKYIKDVEKENNMISNIKINDKVNKNINIIKKEKKQEIYNVVSNIMLNSVLKETDESNSEENILENIITNNKELTTSLKELCKTPKKEVIKKKTKTKEELTEFKRKQKLYKEAMKQIGFI